MLQSSKRKVGGAAQPPPIMVCTPRKLAMQMVAPLTITPFNVFYFESTRVIVAFCFFFCVIICHVTESDEGGGMGFKLCTQMRSIASDPLPSPRDVRLKKWNKMERLYPA